MSAREQTLEQNLKDLRGRLYRSGRAPHPSERSAFDAIGGDDLRQKPRRSASSTRGTEEVAEQYVRVRSAATMLQWAIERYRREKQAPLLKRAGQAFAILTGGSFSDLRVDSMKTTAPNWQVFA